MVNWERNDSAGGSVSCDFLHAVVLRDGNIICCVVDFTDLVMPRFNAFTIGVDFWSEKCHPEFIEWSRRCL